MQDFAKIIQIVFIDNIGVLLFLSFSWLLFYFLARFADLATAHVLLRIPYYVSIRWWRFSSGVLNLRKAISELRPIPSMNVARKVSEIGKYISRIDRELSKPYAGRLWIPRTILRETRFVDISKTIFRTDVALLEGDQMFYEVLSSDVSVVTKGLLYAVGSPLLRASEVVGILFHALEFGPIETRELSICLAKANIKGIDQLQRFERIVSKWDYDLKKKGEEAAEEVRERLIREGKISKSLSAQA